VTDLNWTKGINPKTGKPYEYDPSSASRPTTRWRARCAATARRGLPDLARGVAHQPTAFHPVKNIAYGSHRGCFTQNGAAVVFKSKDGDVDVKASEKRDYSSDLYYGSVTAFDTVGHRVIAKA